MSAVLNEDPRSIAQLIAEQQPGFSPDRRFHTDPELYELEHIIYRNWIFAGHETLDKFERAVDITLPKLKATRTGTSQ